jgi:CRP-like cAMP-binding protein
MAEYIIAAGSVVFRQGDPSDTAYTIESGKVEVYRESPSGEYEHVAFLGAGQIFGEYGVLDGAPRGASVRAVEHTILRTLHLEREDDE